MHPIPLVIFNKHTFVSGMTGSGKSYTMRGIIELLLDSGKRVCIVDPKGDHYGIKLGADGKSAGYPVMALGDFKNPKASDLHINHKSGKEIGELIATGNRPAVIGFRGWMPSAMNEFWIDFASTLFNKNDSTLYLVIDEIHNFAPKGKILDPAIGKCIHWTNRLCSEGRGIGIRLIFASQRPQKVHNDTLSSAETLIAMRATHPSTRGAIHEWLQDYSDDNARGKEILSSLATIKTGTGFVWSPEHGFYERISFPMIHTFDSFAAPKDGKQRALSGWASVDMEQVKATLSKVVEEAAKNDPDALKKRIRELETEIRKGRPAASHDTKIERELRQQIQTLESQHDRTMKEYEGIVYQHVQTLKSAADVFGKSVDGLMANASLRKMRILTPRSEPPQKIDRKPASPMPLDLDESQRRILSTIRMLNWRGIEVDRECLARWMNLHPTGGRYTSNLAMLRARGYLDGLKLTEIGIAAAVDHFQTGLEGTIAALKDEGQVRIMSVLDASTKSLTREELAEKLNLHPTGGRFTTNLAWLRTMKVINPRGDIFITDGARA